MKKTLFSLCVAAFLAIPFQSHAQLPGSKYAKNFILTDISGNVHNLHQYLDSGKVVVLDVSATWCGPCWSLHQTHVLENLHQQHGPNGTISQDMVVLWFEGSRGTLQQLQGVGNTQGNWTQGVTHPLILNTTNQGNTLSDDYDVPYYPSVYMIFPDRTVKQMDLNSVPATVAGFRAYMTANMPPAITATADAWMFETTKYMKYYVCEHKTKQKAFFQTRGLDTLRAATITMKVNGTVVNTINWTGEKVKFDTVAVTFPEYVVNTDGQNNIEVEVAVAGDTVATNNKLSAAFNVTIAPTASPATENFSNASNVKWERIAWFTQNMKTGTPLTSISAPCFYIQRNGMARLITIPYTVSNLQEPAIKFKWSYAPYTQDGDVWDGERLIVSVKKGCAATPDQLFELAGTGALKTSAPVQAFYLPTTDAQWRDTVVKLGTNLGSEVIIVFDAVSGEGNNIYIDDFAIGEYTALGGGTTGLDIDHAFNGNLTLYPNPVTENATFNLTLNESATVNYVITNMIGQTIYRSETEKYNAGSHEIVYSAKNLQNGTYLVTFQVNGVTAIKKMTVVR